MTTLPQQGWICPKCQAVMAPFQPTCWYCKPVATDTRTSGSSTLDPLRKIGPDSVWAPKIEFSTTCECSLGGYEHFSTCPNWRPK
jgi:hypothetical protein